MTTRPEHLTHADATSPGDVGVSSVAMESDDSDAHLHLYDSQSFSPATDAPHEPVTPDFRKEMLQPHPTGAAAARRPPSIPLSPRKRMQAKFNPLADGMMSYGDLRRRHVRHGPALFAVVAVAAAAVEGRSAHGIPPGHADREPVRVLHIRCARQLHVAGRVGEEAHAPAGQRRLRHGHVRRVLNAFGDDGGRHHLAPFPLIPGSSCTRCSRSSWRS